MRTIQGKIGDCYHLQKMFLEFHKDTGRPVAAHVAGDLSHWLEFFCNPRHFMIVCKHGKQWVGMAWGELPPQDTQAPKKLQVFGVFIRRGFRGRMVAIKQLTAAVEEAGRQSGAVALSAVVPENLYKGLARKGFKVSGIVVEKELRGEKDKWPVQEQKVSREHSAAPVQAQPSAP